tara:strand:- start:1558 stop:2031 length:474 start_codon:yes stop_codon:yes gene_type:complete
MKLFGDNKKNFNVVIALVLALLFIAPHMTGSYPGGYNPVQVLNEALPSVSLVAVAAIMLLLLLGIFGRDLGESLMPIIAVVAIGFVIYIFGATSALNLWTGPATTFSWWTDELTELLVIILIFGLIVWFITRDTGESKGTGLGVVKDFLKGLTEKRQ